MRRFPESLIESVITLADGAGGIDVQGRAVFLGESPQGNLLTIELSLAIFKTWGSGKHEC